MDLKTLAAQHAEERRREAAWKSGSGKQSRSEDAYLLDFGRALVEAIEGEVRQLPHSCWAENRRADVLALLAKFKGEGV